MSTAVRNSARLSVRLSAEFKELIQQAAVVQGQSISDFAVSTLVGTARKVMHEHNVTVLSNRDRDIFLALLDKDIKPNKALLEAANRYKKAITRGASAPLRNRPHKPTP